MLYSSDMGNHERRNIPPWAERERTSDLAWIGENLQVFWPVAQVGFEELGRGAIVVDITSRPTGEGHPFGYLPREVLDQFGDGDTQRMVAEYDPAWEMVAMLLKPQDRSSTYRIGVPSALGER